MQFLPIFISLLDAFWNNANRVQRGLKLAKVFVVTRCFYGIKSNAQGFFFFTLAIIPWPTLKRHDKHVIANEMRPFARLQYLGIGRVSPQFAQLFSAVNASLCASLFERGAEIANGGYLCHVAKIAMRDLRSS